MRLTRQALEQSLIIGIAGFIGANVRSWVSGWAAATLEQSFPWGTLIINFSGSCLLAVFIGWSGDHITLDPRNRLFVAIGFLGRTLPFRPIPTKVLA